VRFKFQFLIPLIAGIALLAGCNSQASESRISEDNDDSKKVITYDGQIKYGGEKSLGLTIKLYPSSSTEGSFDLSESLIENDIVTETSASKGFYIVRPLDDISTLTLENSAREKPLRRSFMTERAKIREQNFRHKDLTFLLTENHLQLVEENIPVSSDPEDFFYKPTTPEFTVEGYMTYRGDTSFFYETNTKITWPLTKFGSYTQAAREHNTLADKKNDTTYLKATAYVIAVARKKQKVDALVLKKIIQSSSL
jgi:hypothetical protein